MLALVPFLIVWTSTAWKLGNGDAVYVSCRSCHFNRFFGNFIGSSAMAVDHKHPTRIKISVFNTAARLNKGGRTFALPHDVICLDMFAEGVCGIVAAFSLQLPFLEKSSDLFSFSKNQLPHRNRRIDRHK